MGGPHLPRKKATRPPLYLTASEAQNWFSQHSEDIGREVVIVAWKPAESDVWPPRPALGWNARGEWVWLDAQGQPEGVWP